MSNGFLLPASDVDIRNAIQKAAAKVAMPGWRDKMAGPIWSEFRACITSDPNPRGRDFDVYVEGDLIATAHSLNDAKARAEAKIGPQQWKRLKLADYIEDHPYWGQTAEFTNPSTIYVVE